MSNESANNKTYYRGVKIKVLYRTLSSGQKLWSWKGVIPDGELWVDVFTNYKDATDTIHWAMKTIDSYVEINCGCPIGLNCMSTVGAEHRFYCPNKEICEVVRVSERYD